VNVRSPLAGVDIEERQRLEPLGGEAVGDAADTGEQVYDARSRGAGATVGASGSASGLRDGSRSDRAKEWASAVGSDLTVRWR
jgi:hypothetical protein